MDHTQLYSLFDSRGRNRSIWRDRIILYQLWDISLGVGIGARFLGAGTGLFCDSRILTKFWSSLSVISDNSRLTNSLRLFIILLLYIFFPDTASNIIKETPP